MLGSGECFVNFAGELSLIATISYNAGLMRPFVHTTDPLTESEWEILLRTVKAVGNATVARRFIDTTAALGAGAQTVPTDTIVSRTEGHWGILGRKDDAVRVASRASGIVPLLSKDFVIHWRDLEEARLMQHQLSMAKAAAAASGIARSEDMLVLNGYSPLGYKGLMTIDGRNSVTGLVWNKPGDAFHNFRMITQLLMQKGHNGPFAAVVHPRTYADMHRVLKGSSLLEIVHVKELLTAGVFRSSLLAPRSGVVVSVGRQNLELVVSVDTSVAFLGARKMNLPFRVFKAVYLRVLRSSAICTF
jgi:uncharacterized linocin/CFP29 family protein